MQSNSHERVLSSFTVPDGHEGILFEYDWQTRTDVHLVQIQDGETCNDKEYTLSDISLSHAGDKHYLSITPVANQIEVDAEVEYADPDAMAYTDVDGHPVSATVGVGETLIADVRPRPFESKITLEST